MEVLPISATSRYFFTLVCLLFTCTASASGIPDRNVNIIGINPPTAINPIPDTGLKQQNEPACGMKPSNPLHIICAFNDYRGVDNPAIGDAWEGYSYSINGGQTWYSDLLPGHPADPNGPGLSFAADPLVAVAPGVAVIAYIAADRTENADGGLFMQHMYEVNREAGAPWVPALAPLEVSRGSAGQFIDKPFMLLHPGEPGSGNVSLNATLVDGSSVNRLVPAARLFLSHTVFVGNDVNVKSKMMMSMSDDYGQTWTKTKLSESQAINQSSSTAAHGNNVCTVWRRFERNKQTNAILASCSANRGGTWTKAIEISVPPEFSQFDQGTSVTSFRTNSYPVIATDGNEFYAFWAQRSPIFSRVVFSTSVDGTSWSTPEIVDSAPFGHQFMPSVASARGTIQLAWYDSRDNFIQRDFVQDLLGTLDSTSPKGYVDGTSLDTSKVIRNKLDVRTAKITNGVVEDSVQVSQYLRGALLESITEGPDPQAVFGPVQQLEFNFANDRIFKQGSAPFIGDYPNVAAPIFRVEGGEWVSNVPAGSTNEPVDFLIAWSDNRDVRGNVWEDLATPTVYTPADGEGSSSAQVEQDEKSDSEELLADSADSEKTENSQMAVGLSDGADESKQADAEPDLPTGVLGVCVPDSQFANRDRSRNQNVYTSIVRPGVSIKSPSATKPSTNEVDAVIQRAHVVWLSNNNNAQATYTVTIDNQPEGAPVNGRASFLQVPVAPFASDDDTGLITTIDVVIDANSTVARSVFITSTDPSPAVNVSISDGGGAVFGTITLNPDIQNPDIQNPDIQNPDIQNLDIQNVEVHNPDIQNPDIQNPDIQNPDIQNPDIQNPDIQNPDIQNPDIQNPDIQNPDIQNPDIQNPDIQNPDIQNSSFDGSDMENPDTAYTPADPADALTPEEREAGYTDITYATTNNGNTTTAFNLDAFLNGNTDGLKTQLIAFRSQLTESSRNCMPVTQVENQVIFNKINPDLSLLEEGSNELVFGDGSAYIAPGETIYVTLRVWGGEPELFEPENLGLKVESQSCNTVDKETGSLVVDCDPPAEQIGEYIDETFTETVITSDLDILNDGVLIVANDLGGSPSEVTVNGVLFGTDQSGLVNGEWLNGGGDFSTDDFSPELDELLSDLIFVSFNLTNGTFVIDGLEPGVEYRLQLLFSNDVNITGNNTIVTVEGESIPLLNWQDDAINLSRVFIATSPSVTIDIDAGPGANTNIGDGRGVLNAYALHAFYPTSPVPLFSVPESPVLLEAVFNGEQILGTAGVGQNDPIMVTALNGNSTLLIECATDSINIEGNGEVSLDFGFTGALQGAVDTVVTCSAIDNNLLYIDSFVVRVEDTIAPQISFNSPDEQTTNFNYTATNTTYNVYYLGDVPGNEFQTSHVNVFDDVDDNAIDSLMCTPASGGNESQFPIGNTTVNCTAIDANGNEASNSFVVVVTDEIDTVPVINSVSPTPGGIDDGFVVARGANLPPPSGSIAVVSNGTITMNGFVFLSPSTTSAYWVRLPAGFPAGTATLQIQNGALSSNAFPITVSETPGIPIVTAVLSPLQLPTTTATPGGEIYVVADGIDTLDWVVLFTQGANTWEVTPDSNNFAVSNQNIGLAAKVIVPVGLVTDQFTVTIKQGASGVSTPVTLTVP